MVRTLPAWRFIAAVLFIAIALFGATRSFAQTGDQADDQRIMQLLRANKSGEALPLAIEAAQNAERMHGRDSARTATAINTLGLVHMSRQNHAEALEAFRTALSIRENVLGPNDVFVSQSLNNIAEVYRSQNQLDEAEPLLRRAIAIAEKALGADHEALSMHYNNLALIFHARRRHAEAEPLYKKAIAGLEKIYGAEHSEVAHTLVNFGDLKRGMGRFDDAQAFYDRALHIQEKTWGKHHPEIARNLNSQALLAQERGKYQLAEQLFMRSYGIRERLFGSAHPDVGSALNELGTLYFVMGRFADAEPLLKRSVLIATRAKGPDDRSVGRAINNLATLYQSQGRYEEAEPLLQRAIAIYEKAQPPDEGALGGALANLAELYRVNHRLGEADPLFERGSALQEKALGSKHFALSTTLNNLALLRKAQGRHPDVEPLLRRVIGIREEALGPDHPLVAVVLDNLSALYGSQGRFAEAEALCRRAIAIAEPALGADHPTVAQLHANLSYISFVRQDWANAFGAHQRSTEIAVRRSRLGGEALGQPLVGETQIDAGNRKANFLALIKSAYRVAERERSRFDEIARLSFVAAQWARQSQTASSIAQMASRQVGGNATLARLVRERQDLAGEWRTQDKQFVAALAKGLFQTNEPAQEENQKRRMALETRITEIDRILSREFADYASLAAPEPLTVEDAQSHLRDDEALIFFTDAPGLWPTPEETFIWAITRSGMHWVRSDLGSAALLDMVQTLRCGMDQTTWFGDARERCKTLLRQTYTTDDAEAGKMLPFSLAAAHELYRALFGQIEDVMRGKHLLVVPSGPLTAMPFQALVMAKPTVPLATQAAHFADVAWLAREHVTTVLPSVASLKSLRQILRTSNEAGGYIGFGNPLLLGPDGVDRRAWERQACAGRTNGVEKLASRSVRKSISRFFRSGLADVDEVRRQYPLPETTDELCTVARLTGSREVNVHLGARATEAAVKDLSADGTLVSARVVHFATHGLLAGETESLAATRSEPALILTPPEDASEKDDGLLTASEIMGLRLNADWVILSACNTAGPASDKLGAEALSGLARAFFYSGARALLVSHWAVNSDATVELITQAFAALKTAPEIGRAAALQRAMLGLIEAGGQNAHPSLWAPFIVVGEGSG